MGFWKLVGNELYHLGEDSQETKNLADQHPGRVRLMMKQRQEIFDLAIKESPYD